MQKKRSGLQRNQIFNQGTFFSFFWGGGGGRGQSYLKNCA